MHTRRVIYDDFHRHYPSFPYRHHAINVCSSYDIAEPLSIYGPTYYRRNWSSYPYDDYLPPIVQTSVQNDIRYYYDDPQVIYDDDYGNAYRLSRSKVQLVDVVPKREIRTYPSQMVVSTYRPKVAERIILPRSTVVRHTSLPSYEQQRAVRVLPLYHSAPQYIMTSRT